MLFWVAVRRSCSHSYALRADSTRESRRLLDVDLAQRVGPQRASLGSRCVTTTFTRRLSGTGSTDTCVMNSAGRIGMALERRLVGRA